MEEENDCSDFSCTPPEIASAAKVATLNLLPEKSRGKYEKQYELFITWCNSRKVRRYTENVMMAYFSEKAKTMNSATLWSVYSMLRSVLTVRNNIDISQYTKLIAYLKRQSVGYKPKKSRTFTKEELFKFLYEAPDEIFLMKKVVLIMGVFGACRRDELVKMTIEDIEDKDSLLIVKIPDSKTRKSRVFTVTNSEELDFLSFYRRYVALRPSDYDTPYRLFLRYCNGKCSKQVVGMNIIGKIPCEIAQYLNLSDYKLYTGHSFRRTSATLLINGGGDIIQLKRHGGWKSSSTAEGYIEESINNKIETAQKILGKSESSKVQIVESVTMAEHTISNSSRLSSSSGIVIKNCKNCTFNFHSSN